MQITGMRKLERRLEYMAKLGSKKVARASITGAVVPIRKAIRQGVNGATASAELKRAARKTVGSTIKRTAGGGYGAKVGIGVGKMTKRQRGEASGRSYLGKVGSMRGRGVSKQNIHWFVLGTTERTQKSTGKSVGSIEAVFEGVVPVAVESSTAASLREAARKARIALRKEARKR